MLCVQDSELALCCIDIVLCVDATTDMIPFWCMLRQNASTFFDAVVEKMSERGFDAPVLRVKVIAFRDFSMGGTPIEESHFFTLPKEQDAFRSFLEGITPCGAGDPPESALEALALALRSDFTRRGDRQRHVIALFTDAPAHPLGTGAANPVYPVGMPRDLAELGDWWENGIDTCPYKPRSGRIVTFTPLSAPWTEMETWNRHFSAYNDSFGGQRGLNMDDIYDILVDIC